MLRALRGAKGQATASSLSTFVVVFVAWRLTPVVAGEVALLVLLYAVGWHAVMLPRSLSTNLPWLHLAPYISLAGGAAAIAIAVLSMEPPGDATAGRALAFVGSLLCLMIVLAWPAARLSLIFAPRQLEA